MPAKQLDEEALFHAARRITSTEARQLFIEQACGEDVGLAERVKALLAAFEQESDGAEPPSVQTADYQPLAERPGSRIGPYRLMEQIGEGGFGLVFVAAQQEPVKRKVALKVIKPGMDSKQIIARFEAERQALALMDHPNIAKVLDAGATDSGRPYFVMELVRGIPITQYCDQNHLSPRERLELFITVCHAVQHAHQKGIIHRDIKPSNVLVTSHDGKPVAKIIDFGVAKAISQNLTERTVYTNFAQMIGTPLYMSPEQAEMSGLDIDTRSDIYSLGVLLYELLTGSTPLQKKRFATAAYDEIRRLIREEEPPKPSTRLSQSGDSLPSVAAQRRTEPAKLSKLIRGDLDWITMKALEKDRTRRYETASGLAMDIGRYLTDEPVLAGPPGAAYRIRKFVRRNRPQVITAAVILLTLVGGVIGTSYGLVRSTQAEQRVSAERDRALEAEAAAREERDRAIKEKKRANENLDLARKAVESYLTQVTDDPELKDRTDFTSLRKGLLESAIPFFERFALQLEAEPQSRAESGRIYLKLAQVRIESGEIDKAINALRQARDKYSRSAADEPKNFPVRGSLTNTTFKLAYWELRTQERAEANQHYAEAAHLAEQLVAEFPDEPEARFIRAAVYEGGENFGKARYEEAIRDLRELVREHPSEVRYLTSLSTALENSAIRLRSSGQLHEAQSMYQESIAINRMLLELQPTDPEFRHGLANALFNYGAFLRMRPSVALPFREEAGTLLRQLVRDFSSNARFRHMLARNQNEVGLLLADVGRPAEAVPALREAILLMEQLPETYPFPDVHRWRLANFVKDLAAVLMDHGRWDEASELLDKSVRLQIDPPSLFENRGMRRGVSQSLGKSLELLIRGSDKHSTPAETRKKLKEISAVLWSRSDVGMVLILALACAREGYRQEAVVEAEAVVVARPNEAECLYDAACVFALASKSGPTEGARKEDHAVRAVELLRKAVTAGYKNAAHMAKDTDLDSLREREDFKKLLKELEVNASAPPANP